MKVEDVPDKIWTEVVLGNVNCKLESLALKFVLARLRNRARLEMTLATIKECERELKTFFLKHQNSPSAKRDLERIATKGANHE